MPPDPASRSLGSLGLTDEILSRNMELLAEFFLWLLSEDVVEIDSIGVLPWKQEFIKPHILSPSRRSPSYRPAPPPSRPRTKAPWPSQTAAAPLPPAPPARRCLRPPGQHHPTRTAKKKKDVLPRKKQQQTNFGICNLRWNKDRVPTS